MTSGRLAPARRRRPVSPARRRWTALPGSEPRFEEDGHLSPGDRRRAERREGLGELAEGAVDEQHAAQAGRERAGPDGRDRTSQGASTATAATSQPRGTITVSAASGAVESPSGARAGGEGVVLLEVVELGRLLGDERALAGHALDQIVRERQAQGGPACEGALGARGEPDRDDGRRPARSAR